MSNLQQLEERIDERLETIDDRLIRVESSCDRMEGTLAKSHQLVAKFAQLRLDELEHEMKTKMQSSSLWGKTWSGVVIKAAAFIFSAGCLGIIIAKLTGCV